MPSLETSFGSLRLSNPFMAGSGSMTQEPDSIIRWLDEGFGAVVPKTVAPDGCECVDPPIAWVPATGTVGRAVGGTSWNCEGITRYPLKRNVAIFQQVMAARPNAVLIGSVLALAESRQSWEDVILPLVPYCKGFELNVSCPQNVIERGAGAVIGRDPELLRRVVERVREILAPLGLPFAVKLTPMVADVGMLARIAAAAGCDGLTCFNTYRGNLGFNPETRLPYPDGRPHHGLGTNGATSGASIHTISLEGVRQVCAALRDAGSNVAVLASGGVSDLRTALNYLLFGARTVQVYSALVPGLARTLIADLLANMEQHGDATLDDLRGKGLDLYLGSSDLVARVGGRGPDGMVAPKVTA